MLLNHMFRCEFWKLVKIFIERNGITVLIRRTPQTRFIVPERPDLSWSPNSANLQMGEIHNSMVTKTRKDLRFRSKFML
jgi:hypothetical protein